VVWRSKHAQKSLIGARGSDHQRERERPSARELTR
jgi:hypothetical protein